MWMSATARGGGRSNYTNLQRGLVGIVDLLGMMWLIRRQKGATHGNLDARRKKG